MNEDSEQHSLQTVTENLFIHQANWNVYLVCKGDKRQSKQMETIGTGGAETALAQERGSGLFQLWC